MSDLFYRFVCTASVISIHPELIIYLYKMQRNFSLPEIKNANKVVDQDSLLFFNGRDSTSVASTGKGPLSSAMDQSTYYLTRPKPHFTLHLKNKKSGESTGMFEPR